MTRDFKHWTEIELNTAKCMRLDGFSNEEIGHRLGRTAVAVKLKSFGPQKMRFQVKRLPGCVAVEKAFYANQRYG